MGVRKNFTRRHISKYIYQIGSVTWQQYTFSALINHFKYCMILIWYTGMMRCSNSMGLLATAKDCKIRQCAVSPLMAKLRKTRVLLCKMPSEFRCIRTAFNADHPSSITKLSTAPVSAVGIPWSIMGDFRWFAFDVIISRHTLFSQTACIVWI